MDGIRYKMNEVDYDIDWIPVKEVIFVNEYFIIILEQIGFCTLGYVCIDYMMINICAFDLRVRNLYLKINDRVEEIKIKKRYHNRKIKAQSYIQYRYIADDDNDLITYRIKFEVLIIKTKDVISIISMKLKFDKEKHKYSLIEIEEIIEQAIN